MILVLSDGAPLDDATMAYNHPDFLDQHLRSVVSALGVDGRIDVVAIGIGHPDVTSFYSNFRVVTDIEQVPITTLEVVSDWLFGPSQDESRQTP